MKRTLIFFLLSFLLMTAAGPSNANISPVFGQNLPEGYELLYRTTFDDPTVFEDFEFGDDSNWDLKKEGDESFLELDPMIGKYTPRFRSPHNIALLTKMRFGDFILEVNVESTDIEKGAHRDVCFFFGAQNPDNFYYVHVASAADPNAHNIFLVNNAPRTNIAQFTTEGVNWGVGVRNLVRIHRTLEDGMIRVYFNNMTEPIMHTEDHHFQDGYVGIGSFDDTARYYELRVYGPETAPERKGFFR